MVCQCLAYRLGDLCKLCLGSFVSGGEDELLVRAGVETGMHVWHLKALHDDARAFGGECSVHCPHHAARRLPKCVVLLVREVRKVRYLAAADDKQLPAHRGELIWDNERVGIFVDDVGRYFAVEDPSENARHMRGV